MDPQPYFSSLWYAFGAVVLGLGGLVAGGEILVAGAVRMATRFGMSSLLIGLTVVAFGTSMPELFVSLAALFQGLPDIMIGNVVGSNIANIGLILGVCALVLPVTIRFHTIAVELYFVLAASVGFAGLVLAGNFSRLAGLVCIALLIGYTWYSYRAAAREKTHQSEEEKAVAKMQKMPGIIGMIAGGLILLSGGSNFFINGAVDLARHFGVSELVIGLTLAAVGTSLPELASSLAAIRRREHDLLVGNVVGSNLFNLLMVLGSAAVLKPFALSTSLLYRDVPVMIAFSAFLLPVLSRWQRMGRGHGFLVLAAYALYLYFLI